MWRYVDERPEERLYSICKDNQSIEDEQHLINCRVYNDIRSRIFKQVLNKEVYCQMSFANKL